MKYLYDDALFSDFYKEAHGFRPAGILMEVWNGLNPDEKQARWDDLGRIVEENCRNTRKMEEADLKRVKAEIEQLIMHGAKDRNEALLIMTKGEKFHTSQCVEHWVWQKGILFTPYGRDLVEDLSKIVQYV